LAVEVVVTFVTPRSLVGIADTVTTANDAVLFVIFESVVRVVTVPVDQIIDHGVPVTVPVMMI
jgi:hypothetical protein